MRQFVIITAATLLFFGCKEKKAQEISPPQPDSAGKQVASSALNTVALKEIIAEIPKLDLRTEDGCGENASNYLVIDSVFQDSLSIIKYVHQFDSSGSLAALAQMLGGAGASKIANYRPSLSSPNVDFYAFMYSFGKEKESIPKSPAFELEAVVFEEDTIAYFGVSKDRIPAEAIKKLTVQAPNSYSYYVADTAWVFSFATCLKETSAEVLQKKMFKAGSRVKLVISR